MNDSPIKLLLVEDSPTDQLLVLDALETSEFAKFDVRVAVRLEEARRLLAAEPFTVVLLDLSLPDSQGIDTFSQLKSAAPADTSLIVLSGLGDERVAMEAVRAGAQDYLVKNHGDSSTLVRAIRYAIERRRMQDRLERYAAELQKRNEDLEDELKMAREIQMALLPQRYPTFGGTGSVRSALNFAHCYRPASTLSGDFFSVMPISHDQAGVLICDVMGHGVRAALMGTLARGMIEQLAPTAEDPAAFLTGLNHGLADILKEAGIIAFASAFYFVADVAARRVRFANAGHPSGLILRRSAGHIEPLHTVGRISPVLGLLRDARYTSSETALSPHDSILLFTDGLYEAENEAEEQFGHDRLIRTVNDHMHQPCDALLASLLGEVQRFSGHEEFTDDVCMVGMDVMNGKSPEPATA